MKSLLLPAVTLTLASVSLVGTASAQDYWGDAGYGNAAGGSAGASSGSEYVVSSNGGSGTAMGSLLGESDFNYGYLDGSYYFFDFDEDHFDSASGFGAALAIPLLDSIFLKGAVNYASSDTLDGDGVDYLDWQAGVGAGIPLMNRFDLVLEGGLAHRSLEVDGINDFRDLTDGYGWYVAPGVRVGINDYLEINGTVRYINVQDTDDLGIDIKALLHLTPTISVTGGVIISDDANQYGAGLRINF